MTSSYESVSMVSQMEPVFPKIISVMPKLPGIYFVAYYNDNNNKINMRRGHMLGVHSVRTMYLGESRIREAPVYVGCTHAYDGRKLARCKP